jgi:hypothetical protein
MASFYRSTAQGQPLFSGPSVVQMPLLVLQVAGQLAQGMLAIVTPCTSAICYHLRYLTLVNLSHLPGYPGSGLFPITLGQPRGPSIEVFQ